MKIVQILMEYGVEGRFLEWWEFGQAHLGDVKRLGCFSALFGE